MRRLRRKAAAGQRPAGVIHHNLAGVAEIRFVIRAETKLRARNGSSRQGAHQGRLRHPVFPVTTLRPGIGKQQPDPRQADMNAIGGESLQRFHEESGLGLNPSDVAQSRAVGFTTRALQPVTQQIDANAKLMRMRRRVSREKMSMTTPDFERDAFVRGSASPPPCQQRSETFAHAGNALRTDGVDLFQRHSPRGVPGCPGRINPKTPPPPASPLPCPTRRWSQIYAPATGILLELIPTNWCIIPPYAKHPSYPSRPEASASGCSPKPHRRHEGVHRGNGGKVGKTRAAH